MTMLSQPATLGDAFILISNGLNVKQDRAGSGLPISRIETIANGSVNPARRGFADIEAGTVDRWMLNSGDILLSHINSPEQVGKCAVVEEHDLPLVHGMNLLRLVPDKKILDPKYALYTIRSQDFRSHLRPFINQAVNQASVSIRNLKTLPFPLPPLPEQRRIATILDKADHLRSQRRKALTHLDALTKSMFVSMFGTPIAGHTLHPIGQIGDVLESATYGTSEKASLEGVTPVLRMNNISYSGELDLTNLKYMPAGQPEKHLVRDGDLLFNRTNSKELVGKTCVFRGSMEMAYAGYLVRLRLSEQMTPEYLSTFMNLAQTKQLLRNMCKSIVGMANINAKEVQKIRLPIPPLELQQTFARRIAGVERLKEQHRTQLAELDALFVSLQHRAFKGEL